MSKLFEATILLNFLNLFFCLTQNEKPWKFTGLLLLESLNFVLRQLNWKLMESLSTSRSVGEKEQVITETVWEGIHPTIPLCIELKL